MSGVSRIPGAVLTKINQAVGFRLLTKFGERGVVNLGKAIPLVGGLIGGTIEAVSTNTVGNVARDIFIETDRAPRSPAARARPSGLPANRDTSINTVKRG